MPIPADPKILRTTFNQVADTYGQHRQKYPRELFADLAAATTLTPQSRVLELGPGTGQATLPLSELVDPHITAVELGPALAAAAARMLAARPKVHIVTAAFEQWPLPRGEGAAFDLVLAATAWHWLDAAVRERKCADALGPRGFLAVVETHHVKGGTERFFARVQDIYERFGLAKNEAPGGGDGLREAKEIAEPRLEEVIGDGGLFGELQFWRYEWDEEYTVDGYLGLLGTYSNHIALGEEGMKTMFAEIAQLINDGFEGRIVKRYMVQLVIVRKI